MVRAQRQTTDRLRWAAVDEDPEQPALFSSRDERVRHPEFRDLEFVHVRAKTIINEVPAASRVPFRYTINPYRGCSHACTYCLAGETPILLADGRTKPLADIRAGDRIYGTVRRGRDRRYVITEVLDHWSTVKPGYRITLEDGTELIASADHRFLTNRGWKHVIGAEQGSLQRPHLTTNNKLMGVGRFALPPKGTVDYRLGYLVGVSGRDSSITDSDVLGRLRAFRRDGLDAEVCQTSPTTEWQKGFLAGTFDAEGGCSRGILRIANTDGHVVGAIASALDMLDFTYVIEDPGRVNGLRNVRLTGGLRERLRFFHTVDPAITRKRSIEGTAVKSDAPLRVASIEPLGIEMQLYDITTGTGDFIANGVVSHNCFARPSHEYLNLDAGRDFERVIVVKTNAVELLRAELHPRRWRGDHIAMGTNTDPYQRCEGRYKLTRGILEALTERSNPFSILTKSALVTRDLDILAEAAKQADVSVSFSVGTLDPEVWKASEPGTPHPARRLDALAEISAAGIRTGVLVAPVLPGLSDAPNQLEEVVKASIAAGANSISPILLHLRPGVKEQFLPWLTDHRPDLLPLYENLYPRSYAPRRRQDALAGTIARLVDKHGGTAPAPPRRHRTTKPNAEPKPQQLSLGL